MSKPKTKKIVQTKKILYGISNFETLIADNGYYVDKTEFIEKVEALGARYLLFLRPRRFGKSLFLSMLEHYYDVNRAEQFDELFGGLYIGKNPTPLKNSFPILKLNFSAVVAHGTLEEIENSFNLVVGSAIEEFYAKYARRIDNTSSFAQDISPIAKASDMLSRFVSIYQAVANRDFIFREEGVKGFLLAYLNMSQAYRVHSECELNKGYADIYIEPNLVVFPTMCPQHFLIKLKYVKQAEVKPKTRHKLIASHVAEARAQLEQYAHDRKVPADALRIVALSSNEELLALQTI